MRKLLPLLLSLCLLAGCWKPHWPVRKPAPVPLQAKTSHMLVFLDKNGRRDSLCTGTAVGPHAILTAEHCNDGSGDDRDDTITIDLSRHHYHLIAEAEDGRDHVIYLLDGPAFENYLPASSLTNPLPAQDNERVFIYGDGLGQYPPRRVHGRTDQASNEADQSDVDQALNTVWYTLAIVPGDSGSAIYGEDGRVLGLVTYGFDAEGRTDPAKRAVGFALAFSKGVIDKAQTFSIEEVERQMGLPPLE